jgi:hypothetical protein
MRRISIDVVGVLAAASEEDAVARIRAACKTAGMLSIGVFSEDMGPVETITLVPDAVVEGQGVS